MKTMIKKYIDITQRRR